MQIQAATIQSPNQPMIRIQHSIRNSNLFLPFPVWRQQHKLSGSTDKRGMFEVLSARCPPRAPPISLPMLPSSREKQILPLSGMRIIHLSSTKGEGAQDPPCKE